jgi:tetratricopeptide (TPR) repeat protein
MLSTDIDAPCHRDWVSWWTVTAATYHFLGRYEEELSLVRRGLERFPNHMEILDAELRTFVGLGRLSAVDSLLDVIAGLPAQQGYSPGLRPVGVALELKLHGHREAYETVINRALAWFASQPSDEERYNRGRTFYYAGRWEDADTLFAALIEDSPDNLTYRGFRGATLAHLGRRDAAMAIDRWLSELEQPFMRGSNTRWRAAIAAILGERERAVRLLQQALREGSYYGTSLHRDPAFESLRDYRPFQELFRPKE